MRGEGSSETSVHSGDWLRCFTAPRPRFISRPLLVDAIPAWYGALGASGSDSSPDAEPDSHATSSSTLSLSYSVNTGPLLLLSTGSASFATAGLRVVDGTDTSTLVAAAGAGDALLLLSDRVMALSRAAPGCCHSSQRLITSFSVLLSVPECFALVQSHFTPLPSTVSSIVYSPPRLTNAEPEPALEPLLPAL
jgi:hypothetical protein